MYYLDNAATTAVAPAVAAVADDTLREHWANPSALYAAGARAEQRMDAARAVVAGAMGCVPGEVVFTASGSEANNIAILGAARVRRSWGDGLVATGYEHPSVQEPLRMLAHREGFRLTEVPPEPDGRVALDKLVAAVDKKTVLVCAMQVNNESGATLDVAALAAAVKAKNPRCFVHADGVQGFCKLGLRPGATKLDSYATSGHKLHAPKGVGALYLRASGNFAPPMLGGGQEHGIRPGTQNLAYMAAFAKAIELQLGSRQAHMEKMGRLRQRLMAGLEQIEGVRVHSPNDGYPGILIFSMPRGLRSQVMLNYLDGEHDVMVSSGSACSGGAPSHTLTAMGLPAHQVDTALRASFDGLSDEADIDALLKGLRQGVASLARV